jgi:hypothetical protein
LPPLQFFFLPAIFLSPLVLVPFVPWKSPRVVLALGHVFFAVEMHPQVFPSGLDFPPILDSTAASLIELRDDHGHLQSLQHWISELSSSSFLHPRYLSCITL